jgi:phosphoglycerate dehydrogenase-like enzyme
MERFIVLLAEPIEEAPAAWLRDRCEVVCSPPNDARFENLLSRASALIVRTYTIVDQRMLSRAVKLRVVGRAGVGLDNIDITACRNRGIEVVYTPEANTQAVVQYVLLLIGDALRPRVPLSGAVSANEWHALRSGSAGRGREMGGLTIGILGLGRIGRELARLAGALGMDVIFNDLLEIPPEHRFGARPVDVAQLFSRADVLSVHIDGRPANRRFIDERLIGRMKPDAVLINASRGFVVDNLSLARFLREHSKATAMLDVHDPEPFGQDYPLLELANAKLYPHVAARTEASLERMSWVVRDVWAVLRGRPPLHSAP